MLKRFASILPPRCLSTLSGAVDVQLVSNNNNNRNSRNNRTRSKKKNLDRNFFQLPRSSIAAALPAVDIPTSVYALDNYKDKDKTTTTSTRGIVREYLQIYAQLSKLRLASLVTLTAMAGYSINPSTCLIQSPSLLLATTLGTSLCITSANTINQLMEIEHDARMPRTRNRPLPTGRVSVTGAYALAALSGVAGGAVLYVAVNPVVAALGVGNIALYTLIYTPMKRWSVWNTHVGAVVGAVPPLMGWAAVSGGSLVGDSVGGLLFAGVLFAWQFPHFNALSHRIRHQYSEGGYRMMAQLDPERNTRISLRWTAAMIPLSVGMSLTGLCTDWFMATSMIPNGAMLWCAWRFYRSERDSKDRDESARRLFLASLFHMPAIVLLALYHKRHWYRDQVPKAIVE